MILRVSWGAVKLYGPHAKLYRVTKKDGTTDHRVLLDAWDKLNTVKGTGHKTPDNYKLFIDLAKDIAGEKATVMFHVDKIEIIE